MDMSLKKTTYGNRKTILIGQDSYYIALPVKLSGSANATLKAGQPLNGVLATRRTTEFSASTSGNPAVGLLLHDTVLDGDGKANGTIVVAGCIDKLKLESDIVSAITSALAVEGNKLDNIIITEGSEI